MTLSVQQINLLDAINRCGPRAPLDEVAQAVGIAPQTAASAIKKMVHVGLVEHRRLTLADKWTALEQPPDGTGDIKCAAWSAIKGRSPVFAEDVAGQCRVPLRLVHDALHDLSRKGYIRATSKHGRVNHTRVLTHAAIEALIEAGRIRSDAIAGPEQREVDPLAGQRDRLIRIGQQDRVALRRVLAAQFRLPYREVEATMQRLGFGGAA